jgi:hypothetical protein
VAEDDRQNCPVWQDFHTIDLNGTAAGSMGTRPTSPSTVEHRLGEHGDKATW